MSFLPESSKAFLWLSQSSKAVTVIPFKGSLPCEKQSKHLMSDSRAGNGAKLLRAAYLVGRSMVTIF